MEIKFWERLSKCNTEKMFKKHSRNGKEATVEKVTEYKNYGIR